MANYKGIEITENLHKLIRHMPEVDEYRETLVSLQSSWDNLTLLGQLSGTGIDMSETRHAFKELTEGLLNNLGQETLKKNVLEMKSKAQVAVDIMIRNLFERTADIGFLATDDDVRDFLENFADHPSIASGSADSQDGLGDDPNPILVGLKERFAEYVRKYSVYSNIILLDLNGNVVAQLDDTNNISHSEDGLIQKSLTTSEAYVETFRHSDLQPEVPVSLIYSYRVTSKSSNKPIGIMCLCFRFQNETDGIFANLTDPNDWSVIMLLDEAGRVIASSEEHHIPIGTPLEPVLDSDWGLVRFSGLEYIAVTRPTKGYQGYMGPGWYGHVMTPIQHAFINTKLEQNVSVDAETMAAVMDNRDLFNSDLRNIPRRAEKIQRELNRSVWNGNVLQSCDNRALNPAFSKILLWEISNTGLKTKNSFERSIDDLHQTVVSSVLQDAQFLASLGIDIMDRNLYERANDCRWWALTSEFRRRVSSTASDEDSKVISSILTHINSLYTVYENLVVFDKGKRVIAVSNPKYSSFVGTVLQDDWADKCLALKDTESYTVSDFSSSPLYQNRHTYIYAAAIRTLSPRPAVIGGIGIVFDSEPQFKAMLIDALPRNSNGEILPGSFGVFLDRAHNIISSSREDMQPGTKLELNGAIFDLDNGDGSFSIVKYLGTYYAAGSRMSKGYREYKGETDSYQNDVIALIMIPLGMVSSHYQNLKKAKISTRQSRSKQTGSSEKTEIATFYVGDQWLGIQSNQVVEAIDLNGVTAAPASAPSVRGMIMFRGSPMTIVSLKDLLQISGESDASIENHIVVIQTNADNEYIGLLVHDLGEIPEIANEQFENIHPHLKPPHGLTDGLVKFNGDDNATELLTILSVERLVHRLKGIQ